MAITITLAENGHIAIDVPDGDAMLAGKFAYASGTDLYARCLAEAAAGTVKVRRMSFRKKQGVSNFGWTANFIDVERMAQYLKDNGYEETGF